MKFLLPYYYRFIGLFIVISSLLYEISRNTINFDKGLFSINIGLILILISKNKKIPYERGPVFLSTFIIIWGLYIISTIFIEYVINLNQFIFLVLVFSNLVLILWKKKTI